MRQTNNICFCTLVLFGLCAFTFWKGDDEKTTIDQWLREKKLAAISCSPYVTAFTHNSMYRKDEIRRSAARLVDEAEYESSHHCPPVNPKNGNGCSHPQLFLCGANYSKRKILKTNC